MVGGRLIGIVGPSGVGKDSLIDGLCAFDPRFVRCKRVITRTQNAGGEDFTSVTEADFAQRVERGEFSLWWNAHGLRYGIPKDVANELDRGRDVVVNLSRTVLGEAASKFRFLIVINLSASAQVLAERLAGRRREKQADIEKRLSRTVPPLPSEIRVIDIQNDGDLDETISQAYDHLERVPQ